MGLPASFTDLLQRGLAKLQGEQEQAKVQNGDGKIFCIEQHCAKLFARIRAQQGLPDKIFFEEMCSRELGNVHVNNTGKSGCFFMYSTHKIFLLKSLTPGEWGSLLRFAPRYLEYLEQNPASLLCRFWGMYRCFFSCKESSPCFILIMRNAFPNDRLRHYAYDLKGTTEDRLMRRSGDAEQVLKDLNFEEEQGVLRLLPEIHEYLVESLTLDAQFLMAAGVMDYSLLVGIHKCRKADVCDFRLSVTTSGLHRCAWLNLFPCWRRSGEAVFVSLAIVDLLQQWTSKKRFAKMFKKCIFGCAQRIDSEPPKKYSQRFITQLAERFQPCATCESCLDADGKLSLGQVCAGVPRNIADHLAFAAYVERFINSGESPCGEEAGLLLLLGDLLADPGQKRSIQSHPDLPAFQQGIQRLQLPRFQDAVTAYAAGAEVNSLWSSYISTFRNKTHLKGCFIERSSKQYAFAFAVSIGVDAAVRVQANLDILFQPLFQHCPTLKSRPAACTSFRWLDLPEEGSWMSEPHHLPGLQFWDMAPEEFRRLRLASQWSEDDYRDSICRTNLCFISVTSNSRSGETFFYTGDSRLLVKTISRREVVSMMRLLRLGYVDHLLSSEGSLLARIYGVHRVQVDKRSKRIYFVVQENILRWPNLPIHQRFDLKGSTRNRIAKPSEFVFKDLNWQGSFNLDDKVAEQLRNQHVRDCALLVKAGVLDYSTLVGIHFLNTLRAEEANDNSGSSSSLSKWSLLRQSLSLKSRGSHGPFDASDNRKFLIGIIDYLIPWDNKKRGERLLRSASGTGKGASCIFPEAYATRHMKFFSSLLQPSSILTVDTDTEVEEPVRGESCILPGQVNLVAYSSR